MFDYLGGAWGWSLHPHGGDYDWHGDVTGGAEEADGGRPVRLQQRDVNLLTNALWCVLLGSELRECVIIIFVLNIPRKGFSWTFLLKT